MAGPITLCFPLLYVEALRFNFARRSITHAPRNTATRPSKQGLIASYALAIYSLATFSDKKDV